MRIEDLIAKLGQLETQSVAGVEGATVSKAPPLCAYCEDEIDHLNDAEFNRWLFVWGRDIFFGFHVERFCSAAHRDLWWRLGADKDLFEIHTPGDLPTHDHRRPSFFWASPQDPRWEESWAQFTFAAPVRVVVADEDPGQAIEEYVFLRDGREERIEHRRSLVPKIMAIPAGTNVEKRIIPEQIVDELFFADPVSFHRWWRTPEEKSAIIHRRTFEVARV